MPARISSLFISTGHNFFGHHGLPPGAHPMLAVDHIDCVAGRGIRGDRFFDFKPDYKGQITFFQAEDLAALWHDLAVPPSARDPAATRRNVITESLSLPDLIGEEFELQGVRFLGTEECRPCYWMDGAIVTGAEQWMRGRGGLRARILTDGILRAPRPDAPRAPLAALFAGGKSSRMGHDKALIPFHGQPLWQRQLTLLHHIAAHACVVAPAPPPWLPTHTPFAADDPAAPGPLGALLRAVAVAAAHPASHVIVLAVDLPAMHPAIFETLMRHTAPGVGAVFVTERGFEPLAALYPAEALRPLREFAASPSPKLQDAITRLIEHGAMRAVPLPAEFAPAFFNLNTPHDLEQWNTP
jgi:molybdopterin-guanine dinucleotide biosynthesis protein A